MSMVGKTITELTQDMDVTKRTIRYHLKQIDGGKHKNENGVIIVTPQEVVALYERIKGEKRSLEELGFPNQPVSEGQAPALESDSENDSLEKESDTMEAQMEQENEDKQASDSRDNASSNNYSVDQLLEAVKYLNDKVVDANHQVDVLEQALSHRDQIISDRDEQLLDLQEQLDFYQDQMATQHKLINQEQQLHLHTKQLLDKVQAEKLQLAENTHKKSWFTRWFIGG